MQFVHESEFVRPPNAARSNFPRPRIASDNIEVRSMLDGKMYSSKGRLRETYRSAGVEEVGNEPIREVKNEITAPAGLRDDLRRAWSEHT